LILLAAMGGVKVEEFNLMNILSRRISVTGTTLRARTLDYQIRLTHDFWKFARPLFEDGSLRPVVDKVLSINDASMAHHLLEENKSAGKVLLKIDDSMLHH